MNLFTLEGRVIWRVELAKSRAGDTYTNFVVEYERWVNFSTKAATRVPLSARGDLVQSKGLKVGDTVKVQFFLSASTKLEFPTVCVTDVEKVENQEQSHDEP